MACFELAQRRQHILRLEAGRGAPDMALRRQFNAMLRSLRRQRRRCHRQLQGGSADTSPSTASDRLHFTLITHNCQQNPTAQKLSLGSAAKISREEKSMAITCMQEPLQIIGVRPKSEQKKVYGGRQDWPLLGLFTQIDVPRFPTPFRLLNVHLNPSPWPDPGQERSDDLRQAIAQNTPNLIMGDFNELRNGPCDTLLSQLGYIELSASITDPTWFAADTDDPPTDQNIDRVYCHKSLLRHMDYQCRLSERYGSDHAQVICSICMRSS